MCRKTLRSYRMHVCIVCTYYIIRMLYEIRLIAREKRTTILYAILPSSRIITITIIIILIIYNWTVAAECSRRKEFSTTFCSIHSYAAVVYKCVCARARPLLTVLHIHRYYIIYSRGPTFRGLRYFPYSQQMVFLFIFPYMYISSVYYYYYHYILLLPSFPPTLSDRRLVAVVGCRR